MARGNLTLIIFNPKYVGIHAYDRNWMIPQTDFGLRKRNVDMDIGICCIELSDFVFDYILGIHISSNW